MHVLAFLFFSGLLFASAALIRSMLCEASDKIEAALAGEYRLKPVRQTPAYIARRLPSSAHGHRKPALRRIAA